MDKTKVTGLNPAKSTPLILMPLPDYDFDPTESAIPWKVCTSRGWRIAFSTEHGSVSRGDLKKLKGPLPGLLSASEKARTAYREMTQDPDFHHLISYAEIDPIQYLALLLPGGDTPRMRQYLENTVLQRKVLQFWQHLSLLARFAMECWCWLAPSIPRLDVVFFMDIRSPRCSKS